METEIEVGMSQKPGTFVKQRKTNLGEHNPLIKILGGDAHLSRGRKGGSGERFFSEADTPTRRRGNCLKARQTKRN